MSKINFGNYQINDKPDPMPSLDPILKDLEQKGLMISTPVLPQRSRHRACSIEDKPEIPNDPYLNPVEEVNNTASSPPPCDKSDSVSPKV